jgi:hypothetical protein
MKELHTRLLLENVSSQTISVVADKPSPWW